MDGERTERLAGRAAAEGGRSFDVLVRRVLPRLQVWIPLRMGPVLRARLTADDALQETLIEAHRSLGSFRDQGPGSFQRWLFSVAENRLRDLTKFHTAQRRDAAREEATEAERAFARQVAEQTSPSSRAGRAERIDRLVRRIEALEPADRELVILRALEERSFRELAERTGRSRAAVAADYGRALLALKRDLAALDDGGS